MSDIRYDVFQHYGTNAERLAFTPSPAVGIQPLYVWYETDTGNAYVYHTSWTIVAGSGASGINQLTGDVTAGPGVGSQAATITSGIVSNVKLAYMVQSTVKGRITASTGVPEDLTTTQLTTLVNTFIGDTGSGGTKGLVLAPTAGDAAANKFLKANGAWEVPTGIATGDVVGPASSTDSHVVLFSGTTGKVIKSSNLTLPTGDVTGPASATDSNITLFSGTTGKVIQNSDIISTNLVTSTTSITDNSIVRGDGGAKIVQGTAILVDDSNNITNVAALAIGSTTQVANTKLCVTGQLNIVPQNHSAAGATETIDLSVSNEHTVILDENVTLALSNPVDGGRYVIVLIQDGTGTNTVAWPSTVRWPGGITPTITATANKADIVTLYYISSLTIYIASINQDYTTT